jgi:2-polyprenyl-3-methyl-5-hydroxy-6-metoxy-1,4-benzoquinol methylase
MEIADHSVSGETFTLWQCNACTLRFTQDAPSEDAIAKYYQSANYISHSNTKAGFINRLYHLVRNYTLGTKKNLLIKETGLNKGALLDIGAGAGIFSAYMQNAGWKVTGLEPDPQTREKAFKQYHIKLEPSAKLFELLPQSFNAITMWHVLEHVHRMHDYLEELKRLLKPGGVVFIAVPNYTSYDAGVYKNYWAAYDVPIHLYHFSPRAMKKLLQIHGFKIRAIRRMWFDSFYVSMLSEKYKAGKGNIVNGILTGFISNIKALIQKERCSSLVYIVER